MNERGAAFTLTTVAIIIIVLATVLAILLFFKGGFTTGSASISRLLGGAEESADETSVDAGAWYGCPEGQKWGRDGVDTKGRYSTNAECTKAAYGEKCSCMPE